MAITAVLFDYSGVMTTSFGIPDGSLPFDPDALFLAMVGAVSNTEVHPFHDLERGELSLDDFVAHIESIVPNSGAAFRADSELNVIGALSVREDRVALVRRLAADGVRVGLVTNNVAEWEPLWRPRLPEDLFEVVIDSSAVGIRKPDPAIYELAIERMGRGLTASETLFVDDFEWNVTGAVDAGLQGLHCTAEIDLDQAVADALAST